MTTPEQRFGIASVEVEYVDGELYGEYEQTSRLSGNDMFNARVRAVLGVTDQDEPVSVEQTESTANPWGCETFESYESVTISCAGKRRFFDSLPDLFRALDRAVI